jgi:hypothetical protein
MVGYYAFNTDTFGLKTFNKVFRVGIITYDTQQKGLSAEAGDIVRHVTGSAERLAFPGNLNYRHWRFGRNARNFAPHKFVNHQVSKHKYPLLGKFRDVLR